MSRTLTRREYAHEMLGDRFESALSLYDTQRRIEVLVDEFLSDSAINGKATLEVGCGLGHVSQRLVERGARLVACDLGAGLLQRTRARAGCEVVVADAMRLSDTFGTARFDVVVSSECIEHTPDPARAVHEMLRVLRPGGLLSISTPNVVWWPAVRAATILRVRPFDGLENFSSWRSLKRTIEQCGGTVIHERGLHLIPFQLRAEKLSRWCDDHCQKLRGLMINICVLARKGR
jgi:2-polyprenyl-3-methyl-5-hydroxy-6-metoxy-1,4-benzoquinol methylase